MAPKRRPPSRARRLFSGVLWVTMLGGALGLGTVAGWLRTSNVLSADGITIIANSFKDPKDVFKDDAVNVLILGCDEDLYYGGKQVLKTAARSDMMLVARLDFTQKRITGLSIPRDTRCALPGYKAKKINAYHAIAPAGQGPDLARRAVEHVLGGEVKIDRVVVVDYDAFVQFINLIGGVQVTTPIDLKYTDQAGGLYVDIKKGTQVLDGYEAMGFVRIRKNAGDDYMRQDRQKQLLVGVKNQIAGQIARVPQFIDAGVKVLGDSFDAPEIAALAMFARNVPKDAIKMGALPTHPGRGTNLEVTESKLQRALREHGLIPGDPTAVARS